MSRLMLEIRRPLAALLAVSYLTGCGAVFNGTRQNITANSTPEAAKVTTSPSTGEYQTPITLRLERKKSYTVRFERESYSAATVEIRNSLNVPIVVLDILFGLVPLIVDAATGAWYKLSPNAALVVMTRLAQGDGPREIRVGMTRQADGRRLDVTSSVSGVLVYVEEKQ